MTLRKLRRLSGFSASSPSEPRSIPDGEHRACAADDDAVRGGVGGGGAERIADRGDQLAVEGVALLRAVEHDVADRAVLLGDDEGGHCGERSLGRAIGHVPAYADRPRSPRAARLARGRRRPRPSHCQVRPQRSRARRRSTRPCPAPGSAIPCTRWRFWSPWGPGRARCCSTGSAARTPRRPPTCCSAPGSPPPSRRSPPATPTGPTPSSPTPPCGASGSSTPPATAPPRCCSARRWPPARPAPAAAASCWRSPAWARSAPAATSAATSTYAEGVGVDTTVFEDYPEDWTQALADAALGEGEMKAVDVDGAAILIARRGGHVYALADTCVHREGSLADGELVGECVEVPAARQHVRSSRTAPSSRARPPTRSRCSRRASARARSRCAPRNSGEQIRCRAMAEIKTVGVLGAGLMGHGIAQVVAQAGYDVVLREVDDDRLAKGVGKIEKQLARAVEKGKLEQGDADAARGAHLADARLRRLRGLRPRDRGDHRGPRSQARDVARARRHRQARGATSPPTRPRWRSSTRPRRPRAPTASSASTSSTRPR